MTNKQMHYLAQLGTLGDVIGVIALGFCGWAGTTLVAIKTDVAAIKAQFKGLPCQKAAAKEECSE